MPARASWSEEDPRPFVDLFLKKSAKLFQPGDPLDPATTMGPLVTRGQQERVLGYIEAGKKEGAKLVKGGGVPTGLEKGCYVEPTLFTNVDNNMKIAQEEIFGPVGAVITFSDIDDAIAKANDSIYGLAASIWTKDISTRAIRAGARSRGRHCLDQLLRPWRHDAALGRL